MSFDFRIEGTVFMRVFRKNVDVGLIYIDRCLKEIDCSFRVSIRYKIIELEIELLHPEYNK